MKKMIISAVIAAAAGIAATDVRNVYGEIKSMSNSKIVKANEKIAESWPATANPPRKQSAVWRRNRRPERDPTEKRLRNGLPNRRPEWAPARTSARPASGPA